MYKSFDNYDEKVLLLGSNDIEDVLEVDTQGQYVEVNEKEGPFMKILKLVTFFIVTIAFIMIVNKDNQTNGLMDNSNGYVTMTQNFLDSTFKVTVWIESPTYEKVNSKNLKYDINVEPNEKTTLHVKKLKIDEVDISNFEDKYDISWYLSDELIAVGNDVDYKFEVEGVFDALLL